MSHENSVNFHILKKVLTVCREPADGWRLNRCTRVPDTRPADMDDDLFCERAAGNARQRRSHNFRTLVTN
jgi:hypothetical protein